MASWPPPSLVKTIFTRIYYRMRLRKDVSAALSFRHLRERKAMGLMRMSS